jgi:hypothetical protein
VSGGAASDYYKYSEDFGAAWNSPVTAPSFAPHNLAINGNTIISFYQITEPTLTRSLDRGLNWNSPGVTMTSGYNYALTYYDGFFYAPYGDIFGSGCPMSRSSDDGSTWDLTNIASVCPNTANLHKVRGGDSVLAVIGSDNTEAVLIYSADSGATFSNVLDFSIATSLGGFTELIVYYQKLLVISYYSIFVKSRTEFIRLPCSNFPRKIVPCSPNVKPTI